MAAPGSGFSLPSACGRGAMGTQSAKGLYVNKEQRFDTMGACLQTTPLTDTHTKEPVNATEGRARPRAHENTHAFVRNKRTEQRAVTRGADV